MILRGWAHYFLGIAHYQQNDLDEARQHFEVVVADRHTAHALTVIGSRCRPGFDPQARGENAEAWKAMALLSQFDLESPGQEAIEPVLCAPG